MVPRLLALMLGSRAPISLPLALFGAAAFTILAGASFNIQDQKAETVLLALLAGVLAFGAGVAWRYWKYATGAGVIAILIQLLAHHFQLGDRSLHINLAGLAALGLGGMLFTIGYQKVTADIHGRVRDPATSWPGPTAPASCPRRGSGWKRCARRRSTAGGAPPTPCWRPWSRTPSS